MEMTIRLLGQGLPGSGLLESPLVLICIGVLVVVLLAKTAGTSRRYTQETNVRLCRGCGTSHPTLANFCRRCGRKL